MYSEARRQKHRFRNTVIFGIDDLGAINFLFVAVIAFIVVIVFGLEWCSVRTKTWRSNEVP